ncbi:DNA polymerase III subunit alpha [Holospora obtusa F1]|uniref:DNA polymerase III subunit alpha n=1 Tax=Holospora obtusa F1 TaxID=1399147 RepID=W6TDH6_HOLOB|nr:DNA polymerase III subunit alpha [Holospora obtusa]ETZ07098.1 DNA polymerase III subunit alpha [Holospora obtusa F1]
MYIALRNHSAYSLLESSIRIPDLIHTAKTLQMPAIGLCDQRHLFSAMEFSLACKKAQIFPILGSNLTLAFKTYHWDLGLWVKTPKGYENLCQLISSSTVSNTDIMREKVTLEQLQQFSEGLIVTTGGAKGPLYSLLAQHKIQEAQETLRMLSELYKNHLYVELQRCDNSLKDLDEACIQLAYQENIPLLATNPAFFMEKKDHTSHDALRCIALGRYVVEEDRPKLTPEYRFKSPKEMEQLFSDIPEALQNTYQFFKRIGFLLEPCTVRIPSFPCLNEQEQLRTESEAGLERRLLKHILPKVSHSVDQESIRNRYMQRLSYERSIIEPMGFSGYFLIVSDFIRWAKKNNIPVGPGRGSGASSLVAFCLDITDVDPVEFDLVFERFMNPERVSMPDFDVDFCQERRDEVIAYVAEKYGKDKVAHIITFGTLQARAVLRDVGRVLQMPYRQVDTICKLIPQQPTHPVTLEEALKQEPSLMRMWEEDDTVRTLIETAKPLEGLYRHAATHAAGVIISDEPLAQRVPLYQDENSFLPATEFSMKYIEACGLVKFDFLGLKTLTILQNAVNILKTQGVSLVLSEISLNDSATYELLRRVETVGIFQLESTGMSDVLRQLQPEAFEEIIALVALYRPGPMDEIPRYLACRHKREVITYEYPILEDILKPTYGVMVYQEQVLKIAQCLAGYSLGEADLLRRAMGKKIKSEMDTQRHIFVDRVLQKQGGRRETASLFFDQIAKFAGYAFPKAHAVPYALISYQTAYLKANYPEIFMKSLMNCDLHNTEKLRLFVTEAKRMEIQISPACVNASDALCRVEGVKRIRYGLAAIKNVGTQAMESLQKERELHGPFSSLENFLHRLSCTLNKKQLEALIMAGALDNLFSHRSTLIHNIDRLLKFGTQPINSDTLFPIETSSLCLQNGPIWGNFETLEYERQAFGFYLNSHPLTSFLENSPDVLTSQNVEKLTQAIRKNQAFRMCGMLMAVKEKMSKGGKKYAFLTLSDGDGSYEITIFSDLLVKCRDLLTPGQALDLKVLGRLEDQNIRFITQDITALSFPDEVWGCQIKSITHIEQLQNFLKTVEPGNVRIRFTLTIPESESILSGILGQGFNLTAQHKPSWKLLWEEK